MKYIFRCDSSYSIGSGHLIRCLNLAHLLYGEVIFICRRLNGNINLRVVQNQFKLIEMPDITNYTIADEIEENDEIEAYLKLECPDVVIVDHYGLNEQWEKAVGKWAKRVVAIDDIGRTHSANIIIDQNFRAEIPPSYTASKSQLFLGPNYALLNDDFIKTDPPHRKFDEVKRALFFFGGSDSQGMTVLLTQIAVKKFPQIHWVIVVGEQNQNLNEIINLSKQASNIELHINTSQMSKLMCESDLFIGAGGTTTWERAKMGLPSIVISIAKNQESICEELSKKDVIVYLGRHEDVNADIIESSITTILHDSSFRERLSRLSLQLQVSSKLPSLVDAIRTF